jgi:hypothetical protein
MPAALYAISFKPTGNLLALASFEKTSVAKQADRDALFASLIGKHFQMAVGPDDEPPIKLPPDKLAIDFVKGVTQPHAILDDMYSYKIDLSVQGTAPGDGSDKSLIRASGNQVSGLQIDKTNVQVVVTLSNPELVLPKTAYVVFEGLDDPLSGQTTTGSQTIKIPLQGIVLDPTKHYAFAVIRSDAGVTFGYLQPT